MRPLNTLQRFIRARTDARPAAAARIVLGVAAMVSAVETWGFLRRVLDPGVVKMPYVAWIPPLPPALLPLFTAAWLAAALAFGLGFRTRLAGAVLSVCMGYTLLMDQQLYSNHLYLFVVLLGLMTLADSGARLSLDARLRGPRPQIPLWPIALLRLQVSILYGFAVLAKLNPMYLSGAVVAQFITPEALALLETAWPRATLLPLLAVLSIGLELFLALALWSAPFRLPALLLGAGFHALLVPMGTPTGEPLSLELIVFGLVSVAPYLLFFEVAGYGDSDIDILVAFDGPATSARQPAPCSKDRSQRRAAATSHHE
jgi:hypothetical protein